MDKSAKGFTYIELLLVSAIIMVMAMIIVPSFTGLGQNSRNARRKADFDAIRSALESYKISNGSYPSYLALFPCSDCDANGDGCYNFPDDDSALTACIGQSVDGPCAKWDANGDNIINAADRASCASCSCLILPADTANMRIYFPKIPADPKNPKARYIYYSFPDGCIGDAINPCTSYRIVATDYEVSSIPNASYSCEVGSCKVITPTP